MNIARSDQVREMLVRSEPAKSDAVEPDLAAAVLAAYGGDALAALHAILLDAKFYHDQLLVASTMLSHGACRGWTPRFQRE